MGQFIEWLESRRMLSAVDWANHHVLDYSLEPFGEKVTFLANKSASIVNPEELWVSDGTEDGTKLLHNFEPENSEVAARFPYKDQLIILVDHFDASEGSRTQLWISDGTPGGTTEFTDMPRVFGGDVFVSAMFDDKLLFNMGNQLWLTDGTAGGTKLVKQFGEDFEGETHAISRILVDGSTISLQIGSNSPFSGPEQIWTSDGTEEGPKLVDDSDGSIGSIAVSQGQLFFSREIDLAGEPLVRVDRLESDGSVLRIATFQQVIALLPDDNKGAIHVLGVQPDSIFGDPIQYVEDTGDDEKLIVSLEGTRFLTGIPSDSTYPKTESGAFYFTATDSDGTGIYRIRPDNQIDRVYSGEYGSTYVDLIWGERIIAEEYGFETHSWSIVDGTDDPNPISFPDFSAGFASAGNRFLFYAQKNGYPRELYVSDGTTVGTHQVSPADPLPLPPPVGNVSGLVFVDKNGNHKYDTGEKLMDDQIVFDDANNNGKRDDDETEDFTFSGHYLLFDLTPGTHHIRAQVNSGFKGSLDVVTEVVAAQTSVVDFPLTQIVTKKASIKGRVFLDKNHNNVFNSGDKGVGGFKVFLDIDNDGKRDKNEKEVTTDSKGNFSFSGLKIGTYTVRIEPRKGYKPVRSKVSVHALVSKAGQADFGVQRA